MAAPRVDPVAYRRRPIPGRAARCRDHRRRHHRHQRRLVSWRKRGVSTVLCGEGPHRRARQSSRQLGAGAAKMGGANPREIPLIIESLRAVGRV